MDRSRWDTRQWPTFFPLVWILPSPIMKGSPPFPPFQCWKQINIHEAFATLVGGRGGRSTDEKGVFIQTQNIIASLKALVSVKCLNTFVHDCIFFLQHVDRILSNYLKKKIGLDLRPTIMDKSSWDTLRERRAPLNEWGFWSPIFTFRPLLPISIL